MKNIGHIQLYIHSSRGHSINRNKYTCQWNGTEFYMLSWIMGNPVCQLWQWGRSNEMKHQHVSWMKDKKTIEETGLMPVL